ncbi:MAG: single-stranded DNA-binding protein [Bacteroidales bacterium]|nr:single-stranded DNA-binding protein [Bacteroidales bacterium]MDD3430707.1 single-stranded DNA-binding protein [Bacteroidales bacterium]MDD4361145.1 single-stranded DNA-binding protein [Bacteroidales bacterium]MDD4431551.1 single-stranded DNA-binding protein [Bacteroidales bacterium]
MSINKIILLGNVGKDPDVRYLDNGVSVARFSLATTERGYTLSNGTVVPERAEWHNVVAWRGLAELAEKYIHKGSQLYVEGKITYRTWEDKNGQTRYTTEIVAENIELLGRRQQNQAEGNNPAQTDSGSADPAANPAYTSAPMVEPSQSNPADDADDLPF